MSEQTLQERLSNLQSAVANALPCIYPHVAEITSLERALDKSRVPTEDSWIKVDQDDEHQLVKLERGLYWVVVEGDYEPGEAGSMLYDYPDYIGLFDIVDFDQESGVPMGAGRYDEEWDQVIFIWPAKIFKPMMPK